MSQSQSELKAAILSVFGESDSESDSETITPLPTPKITTKSTDLDDNDLFESDEEDSAPPPTQKLSRLQKSSSVSSKKRPRQEGSSKSNRHKLQKKDSISKSGNDELQNDSEDEYDSDGEGVRTKEDDAFIDQDDDDLDLLREYENDNADFRDDRPEYSLPKGRGGSGGLLPTQTTPAVKDDPLSQALADMKKKKHQELSEAQKGELAGNVLHRMDEAYNKDKILYEQEQPAVSKLQILPKVRKMLLNKQMQSTLLDYDLLSVLKAWIEPPSKTSLVGLTVRKEIYDILYFLPCHSEHIKRSGIGKTLVSILQHKHETAANKAKIRSIIEKWKRPIFNKSLDMRSMNARERMMHETEDEALHRRSKLLNSARGGLTGASDSQGSLDDLLGTSRQEPTVDAYARVRCPTSNGFMFSSSSVGVGAPSGINILKKKNEDEAGVKGKLEKTLKSLKASSGKKNFRMISAAVTAKDKA
mmetsp:Transcript_16700/g.25096  ORF Transcript_16700/g.25096 Transcript_16700/m.25096 type:complete len:473 (-) Transcript_16700:106-1524(-)|eukprot:CAMPEP_0185038760 /NCGR_PEP_ID=MMETSP1103-20130426/34837_1 /TAXON_ID=36769 /ORGANISM="Paraphysomonas bandaiensis, Strain Caron Lab Isolate" /LENGTH=472 /DNA_ID=CAMNT_0027577343 /DNA_START=46 /DNA_END=1464 /DNA_ORIENTATION=-